MAAIDARVGGRGPISGSCDARLDVATELS
jgi:hypothetical protein